MWSLVLISFLLAALRDWATAPTDAGPRPRLGHARAPRLAAYPQTAFLHQKVAQAARAVCEILAQNVGIVRQLYRGVGRRPLRVPPSAVRHLTESPGTGTPPQAMAWHRRDGLGSACGRQTLPGGTPRARWQSVPRRPAGGAPPGTTAWCGRGRLWGSGRRVCERAR
jgi:hypothetical protein